LATGADGLVTGIMIIFPSGVSMAVTVWGRALLGTVEMDVVLEPVVVGTLEGLDSVVVLVGTVSPEVATGTC